MPLMAVTMVNLQYINPPATGPIFGIAITTIDEAVELWKWAANEPGMICTITARADNTEWIQIEGVTTETLIAEIGGNRWIVFDAGKFTLYETAEEALAIYSVVP